MAPIHPGEILKEELLIPCGISQSQLAQELKISFRRINEICQGRRPITIDTALRLSIYFDLQRDYELECLEDQAEITKIKREIRPYTREHSRTSLFLKRKRNPTPNPFMNYTPTQLKQAYQIVTNDLFNSLLKAKDKETIKFGHLGKFTKTEQMVKSKQYAIAALCVGLYFYGSYAKDNNTNFQSNPKETNSTANGGFANQTTTNQPQQSGLLTIIGQLLPLAPFAFEQFTGQKVPAMTGTIAEMQSSLLLIQTNLQTIANNQQALSQRLIALETNAVQQLTALTQQFHSLRLTHTKERKEIEYNPPKLETDNY
ncbi:10206_t:CDS:2 [Entrophospora sp. SA101]|nr:10206_t:CDS:2 [Entrophospora sp. SA101]